jgi:hypothetical protein
VSVQDDTPQANRPLARAVEDDTPQAKRTLARAVRDATREVARMLGHARDLIVARRRLTPSTRS